MGNAVFYVATDGNDGWSGTIPETSDSKTDGPFATLARARNAVRALKKDGELKEPATVLVRGGKYYLKQALMLGPEDSGTQDCPVTYKAYPGETPILSGARVVKGWQPHQGKILKADLPGSKGGKWKFRQLFCNGERQVRARYPNLDPQNPLYSGWAFMEGPADDGDTRAFRFPSGWSWTADTQIEGGRANAFHYKPGTFPRHWAKPSEGEVHVYVGMDTWNNIVPIKSVDEDERIITLTRDVWQFDRPPWHCAVSFRPQARFFVENLLEELDQPGEWCLDSEDGILYFWPPVSDIASAEVVVPALDCLLDMRGVSWVTISGFTLTETMEGDDDLREDGDGYGAYYPKQGWRYCGEAIHLKRAEHCTIEHNRIHQVGGNGIYLDGWNTRHVIRRNDIGYLGANGVCLVGTMLQHPMFNEMTDNEIHHCGLFQSYVAGVRFGLSDGNLIAHNYIHHVPHHAINLSTNGHGRNIIEYNVIRHSAMTSRDTGGINCWGDVPMWGPKPDEERSGHVIRFNLIADTWGCRVDENEEKIIAPDPSVTHGLYLDDFTSNCFVYGNILIRAGVGINVHAGKNNYIENNILVDCNYPMRYVDGAAGRFANRQMHGFMTGNRFCRNIIYSTGVIQHVIFLGSYYVERDRVIQQSDDNIFWNGTSGPCTITAPAQKSQYSIEQWQAMGYDRHSLLADPLFVDPEHEDYRLRPESPALKLGFMPIDISKIGIRPE